MNKISERVINIGKIKMLEYKNHSASQQVEEIFKAMLEEYLKENKK